MLAAWITATISDADYAHAAKLVNALRRRYKLAARLAETTGDRMWKNQAITLAMRLTEAEADLELLSFRIKRRVLGVEAN